MSIDAQLAALDEWAKDKTVIDHYVDLGISARKPITKRPELQRLLRDVEQGRIDLVAFCKLDRWTRAIREYYKAQDVLDAHNVAWRAIQEDYETETASGRLKVNLMLAIAQDEADRTSERIRAVFDMKREKGLIPSGSAPAGFRKEDGKLVLEDPELIRHFFQTYISCRSSAEMARRFSLTRPGARYMLKNPAYKDVVGRETWETAQHILQSRAQRVVRSDRVFLFAGILVCPYCGKKMSSAQTRGYKYYRCSRRYENACEGKTVSERKLEQYLLDHLESKITEFNLTVKKKKKKVDTAALKRKMDKLTDLYMDDLITKEKYENDFRSLQKAVEEAERNRVSIPTEEIKTLLGAYRGLSEQAQKAFWSNLLRDITPTDDGYEFTLNCT